MLNAEVKRCVPADAILDGFTITGGDADGSGTNYCGGGIYCYEVSPTIRNCVIEDNYADYGGGMYNLLSSSTVMNCVFIGNDADYGGGIYDGTCDSIKVINSVFVDNTAVYNGGGMHNVGLSMPELANCTFTENTAVYGGGIYNWLSCSPIITNCIFWNNTGTTAGDEIYNYSSASNPTIRYCDVENCYDGQDWVDVLGIDGGGNIEDDPSFKDDANSPDPDGDDDIFGTLDDGLRLDSDSPCIDRADGDAALLRDICDFTRIDIYGIDGGTGEPEYVDIGAHEYFARPVHFTGLLMGGELKLDYWSEAFVDDDWSDIVGPGEYSPTDDYIPEAENRTFDGIAIRAGTRVIIYSGEDFTGVLLDKTGPAIINNLHFINYSQYNVVMTQDWPEPLQSEFPQSVREWSETDMYGYPLWEYGSFKIMEGP